MVILIIFYKFALYVHFYMWQHIKYDVDNIRRRHSYTEANSSGTLRKVGYSIENIHVMWFSKMERYGRNKNKLRVPEISTNFVRAVLIHLRV